VREKEKCVGETEKQKHREKEGGIEVCIYIAREGWSSIVQKQQFWRAVSAQV